MRREEVEKERRIEEVKEKTSEKAARGGRWRPKMASVEHFGYRLLLNLLEEAEEKTEREEEDQYLCHSFPRWTFQEWVL